MTLQQHLAHSLFRLWNDTRIVLRSNARRLARARERNQFANNEVTG